MAMVKANDVAKLFLFWSKQNGDLITNLKLQKLLYYAQAWHLVNFNSRLFSDDIEAWEFGPVIRDVYHSYKKYKASPISYKINKKEQEPFSSNQIEFLDDYYRIYSNLSATALVSMVHNEEPWKEAFSKSKNNVIDPRRMKEFYKSIRSK